jgi:hypothetical protein
VNEDKETKKMVPKLVRKSQNTLELSEECLRARHNGFGHLWKVPEVSRNIRNSLKWFGIFLVGSEECGRGKTRGFPWALAARAPSTLAGLSEGRSLIGLDLPPCQFGRRSTSIRLPSPPTS